MKLLIIMETSIAGHGVHEVEWDSKNPTSYALSLYDINTQYRSWLIGKERCVSEGGVVDILDVAINPRYIKSMSLQEDTEHG